MLLGCDDGEAFEALEEQREPLLASDPIGAQDRLRTALAGVDHDVVLIDCPPSLGLLCVNGLFAADRAIVVTEKDAVKLEPFAEELGACYVMEQRLHWDWGEDAVRALIRGGSPVQCG